MKTIQESIEHIKRFPVIPVYYNDDPQTCIAILDACYQGGIRVFEFVNRGTRALANFEQLKSYRDEHLPTLQLGIGTIKQADTAAEYLELGADFIVSPIINPSIASITLQKNILWIPGCMTPTEIHKAEELGAPLVKLFPGSTLGPDFLKAIKPLFRDMLFMPTGGVNPDQLSISKWFDAGVSAVGMGSKLFEPPADAKDYNWLTAKCQEVMRFSPVSSLRGPSA
ncbi:bifunctional 4-hydroxy-2-oxoglutarate aldolase/2-dehydro-3-deoxy-phosphogluconate aldolase [Olivibacter sp. SDN3]|uniref:bifunctional 4-hydroxy-2-oxoglutarate aldolase/2-dehydro-3-deoxy-phosphogluconate aldolase n=1 Tax=Olivibacter sp. SDN3 TaxID=2764720 RepID=UPI00165143A1|nr:bifunctional 4-hydroxy-2-oxoglutarate aldolase/2-dehydro-3-deoxy-phosphogluconate aldolase [Olivibacter sp. SDN3]QNL50543.1 bifunctional 4-hydroxy-2-oxoglutarate aldolase/2-dehydro-3-deoxy-phosphogluconate aldolase [Olivibacter sp. SDN3]